MAEGVIQLLKSHDAMLFAAVVPRHVRPSATPTDYLRKDLVFLLERYFYFLELRQENGLLVMDGSDKAADRHVVRCMERYFTLTQVGRQRTQWIVPVPLFVESDMAYGVQAADLCIYCLNWGWRSREMTEATRAEIEPFVWLLGKFMWHGDGERGGKVFKTHGVFYLPNLYEVGQAQEKSR